jgi:16S rRNA (guanine527-N7)-methyltransferase
MPPVEQLDHGLGFVWVVESELSRAPRSVLDLGSGGGPPGLVLAASWPPGGTRAVLLEANGRRSGHLRDALARLPQAADAVVVTGRAEDLGRQPGLREAFEVVTARSFGPPAVTAECGGAFLRPGGLLVVSEPPGSGEADDRWPAEGLAELGLARPRLVRFADRFSYRVLEKTGLLGERYPRRTGVPARRPLF